MGNLSYLGLFSRFFDTKKEKKIICLFNGPLTFGKCLEYLCSNISRMSGKHLVRTLQSRTHFLGNIIYSEQNHTY